MNYRNILVTKEKDIAIVQLNRPQALNALSSDLMTELADALEACDKDHDIHVMILTGGANVFAAGADLREMSDAKTISSTLERKSEVWGRIQKISKPMIAAVNGYCLGGGNELAMSCDMILASESASFGQPEVNVGLMPGAGGTQRLPRIVGKQIAMEMVLTGRRITAEEAFRIGLVNHVIPTENLMGEAKKLAHEIASKPTHSVQATKKAILRAQETTLEDGLRYEHKAFSTLIGTEDVREGLQAFLEKRKPAFKER